MSTELRLDSAGCAQDLLAQLDDLLVRIAEESNSEKLAALHVQAGHILRRELLDGVAALKHFQEAFKLDSSRLDAVGAARSVYRELGRLALVQKLLNLEIAAVGDAGQAAPLYRELGDVLVDQGQPEAAAEAYAEALRGGEDVGDLLEDVQVDEEEWPVRVGQLMLLAESAKDRASRTQILLRAAGVARVFSSDEAQQLLLRAYQADPFDERIAALFEGIFVEADQVDELLAVQSQLLTTSREPGLQFCLGSRWAQRQFPEVAVPLLLDALRENSERTAATGYLLCASRHDPALLERIVALGEELAPTQPAGTGLAYLLASSGLVAGRDLNNIETAHRLARRLAELAPTNGALNELLSGAASASLEPVEEDDVMTEDSKNMDESNEAAEVEMTTATDAAESVNAPAETNDSGEGPVGESQPVDQAEVQSLLEKLEAAEKRPHEYVKILVSLGDALGNSAEALERYREAASLYAEKRNLAEASKVYERILELDSADSDARAFLREAYESQRKYDKLVDLMKLEAEALPSGPERAEAYKQIAELATERIKKPEICIELWDVVLMNDGEDADALKALAQLFERGRDYENLVATLERVVPVTYDEEEKVGYLTKLGQIAGDRLKDDERAAEAYRQLLVFRPDDRRAQEQLKKRYVSLGRWEDLEEFYEESGNWDEFIRLLESNESKAETPESRISMLQKIAELWVSKNGKPDRASRALEKILSIDEKNLDAADRLIPIYEEANNPKGLVSAIEVKLAHLTEPQARLELLRQVATLYEERLRDKGSALSHLLEAVSLDSGNAEILDAAELVAASAKAWPQVVEAYDSAVESSNDPDAIVGLRLRVGRIQSEELDDTESALAAFRAVYDEHPDNTEALSALEGLYQKTEGWDDLLEVYLKKLELPLDDDERKRTQFGIASVQRVQKADLPAAIRTYEEVLVEDPDDATALAALDELYGESEAWQQQANIIGQRVDRADSDESLIELKFRLAGVQASELAESDEALANYREVLLLNMDHAGARKALESMLEGPLKGEAARILETVFESREDWEKLVKVLEVRAAVVTDSDEKVELLRKLANISSERLGSAEDALSAQARALRADPTNEDARVELEDFAERSKSLDKLAAIYARVADEVADEDLSLAYCLRLAALHTRLGDVDAAAAAYEKGLEVDPAHEGALASLDELFRGAERWESLVEVYRKRIELAVDPGDREGLFADLAGVLEEQLGKAAEAISAYQEILAEQPTSERALVALDRLFSKLERWEELASNLEAQLVLAETDERSISLTLRLASLREKQMGEVEAAVDGYREVLERDPSQADALAALERLGTSEEHEGLVAEILEPLYRNAGDFKKLIGVHEVQVRRAEDSGRKVELLGAIAELFEDAAGDVGSAFHTQARALAVDPSSEHTREALTRLAAATGRFAELSAILAEQAAAVEDAELKSSLYSAAARVQEDSVGDAEQAILLYQKVLGADGASVSAAEALERLFQATEQFAEMSAILRQKALMLDDVSEQKRALYQAATLEEEVLERPAQAIAVYEQVLALDSEDMRSVEALIGLFLGLSKWKELLGAYSQKADLVLDPDEKKQVLYEVGAVYERELSNVESAIDTYQRVLELDPDDLIALGRLDVLYQTAENWQELLSVLSREAELTADPEESVGYQYRVANLYETHLEDVERAIELYRELLAIQPDHQATLAALEGLQKGASAPLSASAVLEQIYEASGDAEKLIGALEVQVKHAEDAFAGVELLQRIATLYEENLGQAEQAFATFSRAVALDSQSLDVLETFERLAMLTESWQAAAGIYDAQLAKAAEEPERQVDLGLRAAQVYEVQLEKVDVAIERYCTVLEADPDNRAALMALDRLYDQTENWDGLQGVLGRLSEVGETPDEILEFKFRAGQVRQLKLGDIAGSLDAYREVLAAAPEHEGALGALESLFASGVELVLIGEILEPLYQASAEWEKLLEIREGQLSKLSNVEEKSAQLHRMAEEAEEKLGDVDRAFGYLVRALSTAPASERASDELERLADAVDEGWEKVANAYADVMGAEGVPAAVIGLTGQRLSRVFEEQLGDVDKAIETYRFALSVAPRDLVCLENLDRIYSSMEQWGELAGVLETRAKVASDTFDKVELYLRLGHTYEDKLAPLGAAGALPVSAVAAAPSSVGAGGGVSAELEELEDIDDDSGLLVDGDIEGGAAELEPSLEDLFPDAHASDDELSEVVEEADSLGDLVEVAPAGEASGIEYNHDRLEDAIRCYRVVFDTLEPENIDAIESLERVYALVEQWTNLAIVYQRQLDNAAGDADEADVRAKRAHLSANRLDDVDGAIEGWKRVLDLRGEDPEALRALAFLYERTAKWSELTDVLERHFDIADSDEDRVHVMLMRAKLFDEQLNRDDEALETYQRVIDIDFSNATALRAQVNIWRRRKSVDELVQALHALVDQGGVHLEADELVRSFRELAKLYQDNLEQAFEAADAWRRLLEVGPGDFEALDRLEAIYRADEQWVEVIDVKMQRSSALAEPSEQVRELLEVTDLWKSSVREYDRAVEAYNRVLAVEPLHGQAFTELEKLHSNGERWEQLIELYLNRLEHVEEVPERSDLLRRIARAFDEKLSDQDQAFDALVNAFADDYFDDETADYLTKVCQATNRWPELLTTANTWLGEEKDRRRKIQLSLRLGKWYGEDLGRPTDATAYYQVVLEIDPNNTRVMRQMASIERLAGNYQKAGQMLNKALEVAVANDDRKAILGDVGDLLYRNMDQVDQAIPYYKRALEVDGGYMPALSALERIYEDKDQIQALIEILTKKSGAIERPEDAVKQKLRLGELLEQKMKDASGASKAYAEVLEIDEDNLSALRGQERTLTLLEQWPELVASLEKQLDVVDTERDRVAVLLRLAEIQEHQFLKADIASQRLEQALEIDPTQADAYVSLARCYRRLKQWHDLIGTYQRHLEESLDRDTKLELYANIGAAYRDEVGDLDQAIDAYQAVVDADETNLAALDALSKLFEKQDDSARAIDMMTRVAELTVDGAQQVDMYFRIGRAMEEKLADRFGAREKFQMALDLDPSHLQSLSSLRTIAVDEADWDGACRYLEQEAAHTESPRQKARLLVELGKIRDDMLSEHDSAIAAYEQAIELDADCEEAALPLVHEYGSLDRWSDAGPLAEMLARKSKNRERGEQQELQKLLGKVMSRLGEHAKALKAYHAAHQLDLTDQETVRGVADAAYCLEDWPTALTNYQKVLTSLGEEDIEARTDVYWRLGKIKQAQAQDRQAINNYEKALALDGEHRPSLEALIDVYEKSGDNKQVAEYKRQILDSVFDGEERYELLAQIGDLWSDKENDPRKALEAYEEARDLKPQDHVLLHKMVRCYQQAEEWQKMVDVLAAIMEVEDRPKLKAKMLNTQAQIYRDMLEDKARAAELFNEALDLDPDFLEAFERINKMLTGERNWKQLERSYRKMLHRIAGKGKGDLEHNLWHQLGLIYRDRTAQMGEALQAFKMAAELAPPGVTTQRQILAELYEQTEQWDDAINEQRLLLRADPLNVDPYQALYRLYLHKQAYDEAWASAAAMSFIGKADTEQERFYQDYRPQGMLKVAGRFSDQHWDKALIHPNENRHISEIFKMIAPAALQAKLSQLKAQGKLPKLDERFRQDPATSTVTFAKTFGWAAHVLGVQAPTLYVRNDVQAYIGAVPSSPPASVAGQLVLSGFQPQELTFICGKHLSLYRPEHYLKVLFPTQAELTIMLFAGVLIAAPGQPMPQDMDSQIRATAQELARHMQPVHLEGLRQAVKAFLGAGAKANIKSWNHAVELTACRAGLILCCDLNVAKKIIGSEQQVPGDLTPQEKLKDLMVFATSVEYSALRKVLGVNVQA